MKKPVVTVTETRRREFSANGRTVSHLRALVAAMEAVPGDRIAWITDSTRHFYLVVEEES